MIIKPKFFDSFRCIASDCPDTCCAGWEIDVDEDTAEYYSTLTGENGEYVRSKLRCEDSVQLCREGERCPFLRGDNLCELILRLGEGALCDICREHPRFYSGSDGVTEVGVGLCCPEAARLWLTESCEFVYEDDGERMSAVEEETVARQLMLIRHITSGGGTLGERLARLIDDEPDAELYPKLRRLYTLLEALDPSFAGGFSDAPVSVTDKRYIKLAAYFLFRYYFELGETLCIKFTAASLVMIAAMGGDLVTAAKDFSKEVEYDTDNLDRIYDFLSDCCGLAKLCREVLGG
ncbi:MAG: flagellin lysine-N-methylase [Clostridia bacterium]|nr:flagellin lysine-N-methylase [Clostridia bacterium]